jgi:hypothetical protein
LHNIVAGNYNTAIGHNSLASGEDAMNQTIIGANTQGVSDNSVVIGNSEVTDIYMSQDSGATIHAGLVNAASGVFSEALTATAFIGDGSQLTNLSLSSPFIFNDTSGTGIQDINAYASGNHSFAMGDNANSSGFNSRALGINTTASGDYSTAMGINTAAAGLFSTALNGDTQAEGDYSLAAGASSIAYGSASVAMGSNALASGGSSIATGSGTEASGEVSTAMGQDTTASGNYSTAMGINTIATKQGSVAMGADTVSDGLESMAFGRATTASGNYSTAMGYQTSASGVVSTAMGNGTEASGIFSTAMGAVTTASGDVSTAMGQATEASGTFSTAMGNGTEASGILSTAMGLNTTAEDYLSLAIGVHNKTDESPNPDFFSYQNTAFVIGNGGFDSEGNPVGTSDTFSNAFEVLFDGTTTIAGDLSINSDARLKANIISLGSTLTKLLQIDGKSYTMKKDENKKQKIGVLAQDIEKVFPELVSESNGIKSVNYQGLVPVLINALKEQDAKMNEQESKYLEQEKRLIRLEKIISNMNK